MSEIVIGIIGCSGRKKRITPGQYEKALAWCEVRLKKLKKAGYAVHLVSGGSAGMDHLVVSLEKYADKVTLALPCEFKDNVYDQKASCGQMLNGLHRSFSKSVLSDKSSASMNALAELIAKDKCTVGVYNGFFARNGIVAKTSAVLWSFNHGYKPLGGTARTVGSFCKIRGNKYHIHVDLEKL